MQGRRHFFKLQTRSYKIYLCFYVVIICVSAHLQSRYWNVMQVMARTMRSVRWKSPHRAGLSSVWRVSVCLQLQQPAESCRLTPHPPPPSAPAPSSSQLSVVIKISTWAGPQQVLSISTHSLHITQSLSMTTERTGCWPDWPHSVLCPVPTVIIGTHHVASRQEAGHGGAALPGGVPGHWRHRGWG